MGFHAGKYASPMDPMLGDGFSTSEKHAHQIGLNFPRDRGEYSKNIWNHHLVFLVPYEKQLYGRSQVHVILQTNTVPCIYNIYIRDSIGTISSSICLIWEILKSIEFINSLQ